MTHNQILSQLTRALSVDDDQVAAFFALGGLELDPALARSYASDEAGAPPCPDEAMVAFLDGLITDRRGPRDPSKPPPPVPDRVTHNVVLKKLRVALKLYEEDMLRILDVGGAPMTNRELTTLFRKPGHKHFKRCTDEVMQAFLVGLAEQPAQGVAEPTQLG